MSAYFKVAGFPTGTNVNQKTGVLMKLNADTTLKER